MQKFFTFQLELEHLKIYNMHNTTSDSFSTENVQQYQKATEV